MHHEQSDIGSLILNMLKKHTLRKTMFFFLDQFKSHMLANQRIFSHHYTFRIFCFVFCFPYMNKYFVHPRALAGDIVLRSWVRHFTLAVPLSTQVYKWVVGELNAGGNPAMD